jgi:hypothetical protein
LAIDFFRRIFSANIDPPRRSRRVQGLPPENMEDSTPLPPHSMEGSPQQSEVHDIITSQEEVSTSLENFRIVTDSMEAFRIPAGYERHFLQLNSVGELVVIDPSDILTGSHSGPQVGDPLWTADIVRSSPRMVRDLYGLGIGVDIPVISQIPKTSVTYTVPLDHFTGTTISSTTPSVGPNMQSVGPSSTISLQMAHSTMVPHIATIPTGNVVVSQAPIGTPLSSRPSSSLPLGYRALNSSIVNTTQVIPRSSIPIQQPGGTGLGGSNPLSGTGQSFTSGFQTPGTQPHAGGKPPFRGKPPFGGNLLLGETSFGGKPHLETSIWGKPPFRGKPPFGGKPHAGGQPQTGAHHQPYGQNASTTPNPWNIPFPGNPQFSGGHNPQGLQQPHLSQGTNLYPPYGKNVYPPMGKHQIQIIILKTHQVILRSHMFLNPPRILFTLVSNNHMQEDLLVTIIHLTQFTVLLVSLCHTSITLRLTDNYRSLLLWISQTCLG